LSASEPKEPDLMNSRLDGFFIINLYSTDSTKGKENG